MPHTRSFPRRPAAVLAAAVLAASGAAVASMSTASAVEPAECNALVLDPGKHVDVRQVRRAAREVQDRAVDIRVRVYDSVPDGNLDAFVRAETGRCGTWQDAAGGFKNNLVVLAVDVGDRRSGLYFGDTFAPVLHKEWPDIQASAMNPSFAAGDYTAGLLAGLGRVAESADPESAEPDAPGVVDEPGYLPDDTAGQVPGSFASSPTRHGGAVGVVLLVLLGLVALAGCVVLALAVRRRHRATVAARSRASGARADMAAGFLELEESSELTAARVAALPAVQDSGVEAARALGVAASTATEAATSEYLATEEANRDEAIASMREAAASDAAQAMTAVAVRLRAATAAWAAAEAKVDELDRLRAELPARLDTVDDLLGRTRELFGVREAVGFRTADFAAAVEAYAAESSAVRGLLAQLRLGDADGRAEALAAAADRVHARVEDLPALQPRLVAEAQALRRTADDADRELAAARDLATTLATRYQSECTVGLEQALAVASDAIRDVRTAAAEVEVASAMTTQRFADAEGAAARGRASVGRAAERTAEPAARRVELEALEAELRSRLGELAASCADLDAKITARHDAVAHLDRAPDPGGLATEVDGLLADVTTARPALYTAREGVAATTPVLAEAHAAVDAVVALFDRTVARVSRAEEAVRDARSESHRMGSGSLSRRLADDAGVALEDARTTVDLATRLQHADRAVELAQGAIDEARRSRSASRRSSNAGAFGAGVGFGAGMGSGAGSSFGGGGGGMGGGSAGGMGGGSSSFGGGGDMGGGSSSW